MAVLWSKRLCFALAVGTLLVASCQPEPPPEDSAQTSNEQPVDRDAIKTSISVLVDLSLTWHNDKDRARNKELLDSVFRAVADVAEDVDPVAFRVHPIGVDSLNRPAYCSTIFSYNFFGGGGGGPKDPSNLRDRKKLRDALIGETGCTQQILHLAPETRTEITSAIVTAIRSNDLRPSQSRRVIIILSDLQEDPISDYNLEQLQMKGVEFLVLYRALSGDQASQDLLDARVADWKVKLRARGAKVQAAMDTAASAGGGDIGYILKNGVTDN